MKKVLFILAIIVLFSCEKDDGCKVCVTTTYEYTQGIIPGYVGASPNVLKTRTFLGCGDYLTEVQGKEVIYYPAPTGYQTPVTYMDKTVCK